MAEVWTWKQGSFPLDADHAEIEATARAAALAYCEAEGYVWVSATLREIRTLPTELMVVLDCLRDGAGNPPPQLGG